MLSAIVGPMGAGKTCFMTYLLLKDRVERGRNIFANYGLDFGPGHNERIHQLDLVRMLDASDTEIQDASVAIDEAWLWFDARSSGNKMNRLISHVLLQSRKRDVDIYVTSQAFKQLDVRFRQNCDYVVLVAMRADRIFARIFNRDTGKWTKAIVDAPPLYDLYDTSELIDPTKTSEAVDELMAKRRARMKHIEKEEKARLKAGSTAPSSAPASDTEDSDGGGHPWARG